ncbi:hypothetical protein Q8W71_05075 [Methylobacterium sp. NEAU 140]|uniref:hypothetical protein n=1 Tax=Methylobacterium sp. NEAU 140 TaxID=3064945 RepID=UPI002736F6F8|nr:hypothetical protein [Methylobacterium sp. NEAU 140]MDP4021990.1 hypothetical protein [Methylobacterium sp. NEAU 140]
MTGKIRIAWAVSREGAALRTALTALTHAGRMRHMAAYGRGAAEPGPAGETCRAVLAELERGGPFERAMALQACHGSRDGEHVLRALEDPSRRLRGYAAALLPLVCDAAQIGRALPHVPRRLRAGLMRRARARGRPEAADALLTACEAAGEPGAAALMPYGSDAFVRPRLAALGPALDAVGWARLARHHPVLAADHLARAARDAAEFDPRLAWQARAALPVLARSDPDRALDVLAALARHVPPAALDLQRLAQVRPAALADLLLANGDTPRLGAVLPVLAAHLVGDDHGDRLAALVARFSGLGGQAGPAARWMRRLPAARRRAAYASAGRGWRDADGALPPALVALLPTRERAAEARRHLDLPALRVRPLQRLPYAAMLPWAEARAAVGPALGSPEAEQRAAALAALVDAVRFERARLPEALALVRSRGNEQDPVRAAMLEALARLPPSCVDAAALPVLDAILRQALDAADLSHRSVGALQRLIVRLLPVQPVWAVSALEVLARERGALVLGPRDLGLSADDVRRLAPVLDPVLRAWRARENDLPLVEVAALFAPRLRDWRTLGGLLSDIAEGSRHEYVCVRALALLARHDRARFAALVPGLLRRDPSWIVQGPVQEHLHRVRQDLLDPYLGRAVLKGRFTTGKTRYVLPLRAGFERWLPAQQAGFARTLEGLVDDPARDVPTVLHALAGLAALPDVPPRRLHDLARADNPRLPVRDEALRALARRDAGDGLDALIAALGDERARIAIYALAGALRDLPEARVMPLLRAAPRERVTVFKEIVRLAGVRADAAGFAFLREIAEAATASGAGLHRDVRLALLRALWDHLERAATWPILAEAAADPDPAVGASLARIPADRLTPEAADRLADLLAGLCRHPDPEVRVAVLRRLETAPLADRHGVLVAPVLHALASGLPDESAAAASAVVATRAGRRPEALGAAVGAVRANRRTLATLRDALLGWLRLHRAGAAPAARAVLAALAADPTAVRIRIEIALRGLPGPDLAECLAALARDDSLHPDALALAATRLEAAGTGLDPEACEGLEAALAVSPDARLRRLALATLVGVSRTAGGWSRARVARLADYRTDPAPLVAEAAQFVFPPDDAPDETR